MQWFTHETEHFMQGIQYTSNMVGKPRVFMMLTLSSSVTPEAVVMTTPGATSDDKVDIMITFCCLWGHVAHQVFCVKTEINLIIWTSQWNSQNAAMCSHNIEFQQCHHHFKLRSYLIFTQLRVFNLFFISKSLSMSQASKSAHVQNHAFMAI